MAAGRPAGSSRTPSSTSLRRSQPHTTERLQITIDSRHDQLLAAGRPDHGPQGVGKRVAKPGVFSRYRQAVSYTAAAMGPGTCTRGRTGPLSRPGSGGWMGNWVITDRYRVLRSWRFEPPRVSRSRPGVRRWTGGG